MDRKDLKIEHYRQRVAQLSVEYEEKIAELRIEVTELRDLIKSAQEAGNGDAADPREQEVEELTEDTNDAD